MHNEQGSELADGTFEKTERYGQQIGGLAASVLAKGAPVSLTPFAVQSRSLYLPLNNKLYVLARQLGS